jgi:signal peptidase II
VITLIALGVVLWLFSREPDRPGMWVATGLLAGGALGNLIDRLFRAPSPGKGHVVDWISLFANDGHIWPIFNLADSSIVVGGVLAVLLSLLGIDFRGERKADHG